MKSTPPIFVFGEYGDLAWFPTVEEVASWLEPVGLEGALSCDSEGRRVNYLVRPHRNGSWYNGIVLFGNIESEPSLGETLKEYIARYLVVHHAQEERTLSPLTLDQLINRLQVIAGQSYPR